MNLDHTQKQQVAAWIAGGLKLSDIQKRLVSEFGVTLTYMEVRMLVDDLKLVPIDPAPPPEKPLPATPPATAADAAPGKPLADPALAPDAGTSVALTVDTVAGSGTLMSGSVTFSDGAKASWYMDQHGRLGVSPETKGYKPSAADVEAFQQALEVEVSKLGY